METTKQTAVEQLANIWASQGTLYYSDIEQAKQMEKEQIIDAYETSHISMMTAEQYYNEIFGGNHLVEPNEMIDHIGDANKMVDNRKDKLETLAKLLAKTWFYCDWKWESPNERVMQMLMQDLDLYPFKNEDEMIQQTQVDDGIYKEASKTIHPYGKISEDLAENHIPDVRKMVEDDEINFIKKQLENAEHYRLGYNRAKKTLYTEEEVLQLLLRLQQTESYDNLYDWFEQFKK
jgi:hypothetical protein